MMEMISARPDTFRRTDRLDSNPVIGELIRG